MAEAIGDGAAVGDETVRGGGCACGAVRFELRGEPRAVINCHCRDCQLQSGTGHTTLAAYDAGAVLLEGALASHEVPNSQGTTSRRSFCPTCGTSILNENSGRPEMRLLHVGTLDDPEQLPPRRSIFTESAPAWDAVLADPV